jgi:hypothetical protein
MKRKSFLKVLVFLLLSGTAVQAQSSQTGAKKVIGDQSEKADKIQGKKIQQGTLSGNKIEKLNAPDVVKTKPTKKIVAKKKKIKKH